VADAGDRLAFARSVVAAKLHNQATLAVRFRWQRSTDVAAELRKLKEATDATGGLDGLLGLEGKGSAVYFAALVASLPEEWGFAGRRRQPPPDPVNAMLSFGYTLLYNHAATALTVAGLDPRVGLFHTARGTHQALASDLVEEMRWLVDALVWSLVRRGRVSLADFAPSPDGRYPCWMSADFRRRFIAAFESRLHATFTPPGEEESTTYRAFLAGQARRLREWVRGERDAYPAFCLHA
jgi:CRISPR-associated protein Cas1